MLCCSAMQVGRRCLGVAAKRRQGYTSTLCVPMLQTLANGVKVGVSSSINYRRWVESDNQ